MLAARAAAAGSGLSLVWRGGSQMGDEGFGEGEGEDEQAVDELDVEIAPEGEEEREQEQLAGASGATGLHEDVHFEDEEEDGEHPGAGRIEVGEAEAGDEGEQDDDGEVALKAVDHVAEGAGDGEDHGGGVGDDAGEAEALEEVDGEELEEPAVGLPGFSGVDGGEGVGVGDVVVLEDPLAGAEMPPDVGIGYDGEVEADERGDGQDEGEDEGVRELVRAARECAGRRWAWVDVLGHVLFIVRGTGMREAGLGLEGGGDLGEDGCCGRGWIGGLGDGAADDEHGGSAGDGLRGGGDAALVVGCVRCAGGGRGGRADSGDDETCIGSHGFAYGGDLFGGTDEAVDAGGAGEMSEAEDLALDHDGGVFGGDDSGCAELGGVHAGEDGDGEELWGAGEAGGLGLRRASSVRRRRRGG